MVEISEFLKLVSEYFSGGELLGALALYFAVKYLLKPLKASQKKLSEFMDALIEAQHEKVYTHRSTEKHLDRIAGALERAMPPPKE